MTESARFIALLFAVLVVGTGLTGAWLRRRATPRPEEFRPVVGRTTEEVALDPSGLFAQVRTTSAAEQAAQQDAEDRRWLDDLLGALSWPGPYRSVVVHLFDGDLPAQGGEEGPPWHLVVEASGTVVATPRLKAGRPGVPEGYPVNEGRKAIHVAVLRVRAEAPIRDEKLRQLLSRLARRLEAGRDRFHLAMPPSGAQADRTADALRSTYFPPELR